MRLPFEEWISQKHFSRNVAKLFNEAFVCYKHSAYRASLLFSYLAFLTILKELIIKTTMPAHIPQTRWDAIIGKLQNDDTWEKCVYEEIINSSSPIFNISEDIRQQVKYWKDRRNDCAHFKSNDIKAHHTESFWSFVRSNLFKMTIEGGTASLLNKFRVHFDPTFTPPTADVSPLIKEIEESVESSELTDFWEHLIQVLDPHGFLFSSESNGTKVLNKVFELCGEVAKDSLAEFLKDKKYDLFIINSHPDKINFINYTPAEVRSIWRSRIWNNKSTALPIYGTLLRNALIPLTEINEANEFVIEKITDYRPYDEPTHLALAANGFGETLFRIAIHDKRLDNFLWVNGRADLLAYLIEKYPLKEETVEVVCEMYARSRYSWWLAERLVNIFNENTAKKSEFHSIATMKGYTIPDDLK